MIIPIDLKLLKATMPSTTPTILDQISAEKTKISERLARLDADRANIATQLIDLETAERVMARVSKTPPARRSTSAAAAEVKAKGRAAEVLVERYQDHAVTLVKLALERTPAERRMAFLQDQVAADPAFRPLQRRLRFLLPASTTAAKVP